MQQLLRILLSIRFHLRSLNLRKHQLINHLDQIEVDLVQHLRPLKSAMDQRISLAVSWQEGISQADHNQLQLLHVIFHL